MEAIILITLRQLKRYFRTIPRVIGSLSTPIIFLVSLGYGFNPLFAKAGLGNYIQFLAPGIISMGILNSSIFSGIEIVWDKQIGFLREMLVSPTPRFKIFLGRILGGSFIATIHGCFILIICLIVGFRISDFIDIPFIIGLFFLMSVLFTAIGIALGSIIEDIRMFPVITNFLIIPIFFFSGAIFPFTGLPTAMKVFMYFNPLSYGVDIIRTISSNQTYFGFVTDLQILFIMTIILFFFSYYLFSKIQL